MIKGSILQEHITILNVYAFNNRAKTVRQKLIKLQREKMNPLSYLETSTLLYQMRTDPASRKSVRTQLNSTAPLINWM